MHSQTKITGIWCNGNTTDSGPVIPGSNPGIPTEVHTQKKASVDFFCKIVSLFHFFLLYLQCKIIFAMEERRQNIFITLATSGVKLPAKNQDMTLRYPIDFEQVELKNGVVPTLLKIDLGQTDISFDECTQLTDSLSTRLKQLGVKINADVDIRYCHMDIEGNNTEEVLAEVMVQYVVKV